MHMGVLRDETLRDQRHLDTRYTARARQNDMQRPLFRRRHRQRRVRALQGAGYVCHAYGEGQARSAALASTM